MIAAWDDPKLLQSGRRGKKGAGLLRRRRAVFFAAYDEHWPTVDQAFAWSGLDPLAHGIWLTQVGTKVTFYADTDGHAATVEFMVTLDGASFASLDQVPASLIF